MKKAFLVAGTRTSLGRDERGASAVEFALIAPVFLFMIFAMIAAGIYLGASHNLQQVAAGAARASIAGLNEEERHSLARTYVATHLASQDMLHADRVGLALEDSEAFPGQYVVTVTYDAAHLPIWNLMDGIPLPDKEIRKTSAIRVGGL